MLVDVHAPTIDTTTTTVEIIRAGAEWPRKVAPNKIPQVMCHKSLPEVRDFQKADKHRNEKICVKLRGHSQGE